jgi:hypothetical protein
MGTAFSTRGGRKGMYIGFWCESHKRPIRKPRRRWVGMDWTGVVQDSDQ